MAEELKLEGGVVVLHVGNLKPTSSDIDFLYYSVGIILEDNDVHGKRTRVLFPDAGFYCDSSDLIPLVKIPKDQIALRFIDNLRTHKDQILAGALRAVAKLHAKIKHIHQVHLDVDLQDALDR
jgi:hypothetical protein